MRRIVCSPHAACAKPFSFHSLRFPLRLCRDASRRNLKVFGKRKGRNIKGIAFTGALLALIVGIIAVVMIIPGTTMVYDRLLCYTGAKWLLTPGTSAGTVSNSEILIDTVIPTSSNHDACSKTCTARYTECNDAGLTECDNRKSYCIADCDALYDKNYPYQDYVYFEIPIVYYGSGEPSTVNVSLSINGMRTIWTNLTDPMQEGDAATIYTETFKKANYECIFDITAFATNGGVVPGKKQLSDVPCVE